MSIQLHVDAPVATVILDRPHRRNALDRSLVAALTQVLDDLHGERKIKSVVLTGAGDAFCAGTDLHELQQTLEEADALRRWQEDSQAMLALIEQLLRFPKPVLAAVNGPVAGTGLALVLAADIAIGADTARVAMPEAQRGLSGGLTTPLLSFRLGSALAARLLLTGAPLSAEQALQAGLFQERLAPDLVWARGYEIAVQAAAGARESHQLTKQLINETIGESLWTQLSIGAANMAAARTTPAAREGIAAFLAKREPDWDRPQEPQP